MRLAKSRFLNSSRLLNSCPNMIVNLFETQRCIHLNLQGQIALPNYTI
jgi:hypothetical protein